MSRNSPSVWNTPISSKTAWAIILIFAALVASLFVGLQRASTFETVRNEVHDGASAQGIVNISTASGFICSGFHIRPKVIVTAAHCFEAEDMTLGSTVIALAPYRSDTGEVPPVTLCNSEEILIPQEYVRVVNHPSGWDFAVVDFSNCATEGSPVSFELAPFEVESELFTLGYPGNTPPSSLWSSEGANMSDFMNLFKERPEGVKVTSLSSSPGSSGSGVFVSSAAPKAVGVISVTYGDGSSGVVAFDQERIERIQTFLTSLDENSLTGCRCKFIGSVQ